MTTDHARHVLPGNPYPLGATVTSDGINFSIFSASATSVELLLFDRHDQAKPSRVITLGPPHNKTYYYWHAFVPGLREGQIYAYQAYGPYRPEVGFRFNGQKCLLDPYAKGLAYGANWSRAAAHGFSNNTYSALKAVALDLGGYDWEGDRPLQRPMKDTVIYETHVRSFTAHASAQTKCPGCYAGLVEKIPYLQELGITAVELLPIQQFDEQEVDRQNPLTGEVLKNYWGYAPVAYFAPHLAYACTMNAHAAASEFRDMVKALHHAGIEVILDVVFNHTAEGDETGPWISFRGLENPAYYILKEGLCHYADYTGTGNTVNCNHSIVRRLIRQCLCYWVQEFHVDGFRFDLASVLSRNERGEPIPDSPILWEIESDPVLAGTKLIAEAWDAAGLYQLGAFTGDRWAEWNGRFRDDLRRFLRGDHGTVRDFAWRMTGSFDIFRAKPSYVSHQSINYVTCHDGFTLADLVSYNRKHNQANGENNGDGMDENLSWNFGVEGPTEDKEILRARTIQMKNFCALLMLARGTPMILGGDEIARTQQGNNNAYCQDNEISWYDWSFLAEHADLHRFVRGMIEMRHRHPILTTDHQLHDGSWEHALQDGVRFHGVKLEQPDWSHHSHTLAIQFQGGRQDADIYLIANAYSKKLAFELPPDRRWKRIVDTSRDAPDDLLDEDEAPILDAQAYLASPRSVAILVEAPRT
jgi:isoamylase